MKYFLSFMGTPRSGHTLVAAIINANPNCMISNQLNIFSQDNIDFNHIKSYSLNTGTWKSTTQIPHVPKQEITVVGDKTGHRTTDLLGSDPTKLGVVKEQVGVPIKWIHVVRNPFDNLATWSKLNYENKIKKGQKTTQKKELNDVIEKYAILNQTIQRLKRSEDVLTVRHEFVITRMHNTLENISKFLDISFDPVWRDNVRNTVWKKPRITRKQVPWSSNQKEKVFQIIKIYDYLSGYDFGGCKRCNK